MKGLGEEKTQREILAGAVVEVERVLSSDDYCWLLTSCLRARKSEGYLDYLSLSTEYIEMPFLIIDSRLHQRLRRKYISRLGEHRLMFRFS